MVVMVGGLLTGGDSAFLRFYPGRGYTVEVAASRDILPGEEITHSCGFV